MIAIEVVTPADLVELAKKATAVYLRSRPNLLWQRDDILGDATLAALLAHQRYDGTGSFGGYAYPLVVFAIVDGLRFRGRLTRQDYAVLKEGKEELLPEKLEPLSLSQPELAGLNNVDPLSEVSYRDVEVRAAIPRILSMLDPWPREREVIRRVILQGERQAAVARDLGVTESRVCQLRSVALQRLRNHPDMPDTLAG